MFRGGKAPHIKPVTQHIKRKHGYDGVFRTVQTTFINFLTTDVMVDLVLDIIGEGEPQPLGPKVQWG